MVYMQRKHANCAEPAQNAEGLISKLRAVKTWGEGCAVHKSGGEEGGPARKECLGKDWVTTEPSGVVEAIHMKGRSPPNRRLTGRSQSRKDLAAGLRTGWRTLSLSQGQAQPTKAISKRGRLESRAAENTANRYPIPSKLKSCHSTTVRYIS